MAGKSDGARCTSSITTDPVIEDRRPCGSDETAASVVASSSVMNERSAAGSQRWHVSVVLPVWRAP